MATHGRYSTKAYTYTPSRYAPRVAALAPVDNTVILILQNGQEVTGVAYHERHGVFHGPADLASWARSYAAMYPQRYAVDSIEIGGMWIKLTDIESVK